jgi:hypothetical protein
MLNLGIILIDFNPHNNIIVYDKEEMVITFCELGSSKKYSILFIARDYALA